jgi:hypothetical protein
LATSLDELRETVALAHRLHASGEYDAAERACAEVLRHKPEQFDCLYLAGLLAYRRGDRHTGQDLVARACRIQSEVERFDHMIGLLRQQGRDDWLTIHRVRLQKFLANRATDAFVISYPKCGRTWLRMMLGHYLLNGQRGDPLDVRAITAGRPDVPTFDFSHDDYPHWKPARDLHRDKSIYADKSVVLLVRDPRDVVVSYYFQYMLRGDRNEANDSFFAGSLGDFVRHEIGGLRSIVGFYNIWAANRDVPRRFTLLRYEDLHRDTERSLRSIIEFLGLPDLGPAAIAAAVEFGRFDNMRKLEEAGSLPGERLKSTTDNPEGFKTRKGVVGGYINYLPPAELEYIDRILEAELDDFYASYKKRWHA